MSTLTPNPAPHAPHAPPASAAARRLRAGTLALVALLAVTVCVALANVLATRFPKRFDVTATGEHQLSPRTLKLLSSLKSPYRVILAGDLAQIDGRARERVTDVLDQVRRSGPGVTLTTIDAGSASGQAEFDTLVRDLAAQERPILDAQAKTIDQARRSVEALAAFLDGTLSPALDKVREAAVAGAPDAGAGEKTAEFFRDLGAAARIGAQDLRAAVTRTDEPLNATVRGIAIPATDKAAALLHESLAPTVQQMGALARQLRSVTDAQSFPGPARELLTPLVHAISDQRDAAAVALDTIDRLPRPALRRIADVVAKGNAALVVGPPAVGMTAVEFTALFPSGKWLDAAEMARADLGRRAEELVSSAIGSLERPIKPIVVIIHAEAVAFFDKQHKFHRVMDRLALRGIEVIEWACAVDAEPPDLARLNPDGKRPVVYVSLAPNSAAGTGARGEKSGVDRAKRLGEVLESLVTAGKPVMVSMNPYILASSGQTDPTTAVLAGFGLRADTARPLVREQISPRGRAVVTNLVARAPGGEHPLAAAVKGLPLYLDWPVPLMHAQAVVGGTEVVDLYSATDDGTVWAESQWTGLWYAKGQPELIPDQPVFDQSRDLKNHTWLLAAAAEYTTDTSPSGVHRLMAVGSNTWFVDDRAELVRIDGRITESSPGNLELFESGIYWLAGMDGLIAASPGARAVALVKPLSEAQVKLLRGAVIGAIPVLVLLAGLLFRWLRG